MEPPRLDVSDGIIENFNHHFEWIRLGGLLHLFSNEIFRSTGPQIAHQRLAGEEAKEVVPQQELRRHHGPVGIKQRERVR